MRSRLRLIIGAVVAVMSIVAPAAAQEPAPTCRNLETDPLLPPREVCTERVFFKCRGNKIANIDNLNSGPTTWNDQAPTQSFQQGAGCGALDTAFTGTADHNPLYDAPFAGTYEGRIESLTLHAHVIEFGLFRPGVSPFYFKVHLLIDGVELIPRSLAPIEVVPTASSTGISYEVQVSVTNIGLTGLADDIQHDVQLTLYAPFIDGNENIWVWDASEVPSGINFNPTELAQAKYEL